MLQKNKAWDKRYTCFRTRERKCHGLASSTLPLATAFTHVYIHPVQSQTSISSIYTSSYSIQLIVPCQLVACQVFYRLGISWHNFSSPRDFLAPFFIAQGLPGTILIVKGFPDTSWSSSANHSLNHSVDRWGQNSFSRDAIYQGIHLAIRRLEFGITEHSSRNYHLI